VEIRKLLLFLPFVFSYFRFYSIYHVNKDATTAGDSTDSYEYEQKTPVHKTSGYLQHGRRAFLPDEQRLLLELCKDLIKAGSVLKHDRIS
jgi:hypothetical protein